MSKDPLHINGGPITRARAKKMKEALNGLIKDIWASSATSKGIHEDLGLERNQRLVNTMQVREQYREQYLGHAHENYEPYVVGLF